MMFALIFALQVCGDTSKVILYSAHTMYLESVHKTLNKLSVNNYIDLIAFVNIKWIYIVIYIVIYLCVRI